MTFHALPAFFWHLVLLMSASCSIIFTLNFPEFSLVNKSFCSVQKLSLAAFCYFCRWFPFLTTRACCEACGNLKAAFLVAVVSFQWFCNCPWSLKPGFFMHCRTSRILLRSCLLSLFRLFTLYEKAEQAIFCRYFFCSACLLPCTSLKRSH